MQPTKKELIHSITPKRILSLAGFLYSGKAVKKMIDL